MHNMPEHFGPAQFRDIDAELWVERKSEDDPDDPYMLQKAIDGVLNVGRDNTRLPMQWDDSTYGGFTNRAEGPWIPCHDDHFQINVANQIRNNDSPLSFWKTMIKYRKRHEELFVHGKFEVFDRDNEKMFMYSKEAWKSWQGRPTCSSAITASIRVRRRLCRLGRHESTSSEGKAKICHCRLTDVLLIGVCL
jgi:oligo-1,6-glucosidase